MAKRTIYEELRFKRWLTDNFKALRLESGLSLNLNSQGLLVTDSARELNAEEWEELWKQWQESIEFDDLLASFLEDG